MKQRFHDETTTGELNSQSTAPKARVSYVAIYYDLADRLTDTVDVGTNAGSAYTRPRHRSLAVPTPWRQGLLPWLREISCRTSSAARCLLAYALKRRAGS
jgi:hypothetical protein